MCNYSVAMLQRQINIIQDSPSFEIQLRRRHVNQLWAFMAFNVVLNNHVLKKWINNTSKQLVHGTIWFCAFKVSYKLVCGSLILFNFWRYSVCFTIPFYSLSIQLLTKLNRLYLGMIYFKYGRTWLGGSVEVKIWKDMDGLMDRQTDK